jgi:hypothetical protein
LHADAGVAGEVAGIHACECRQGGGSGREPAGPTGPAWDLPE